MTLEVATDDRLLSRALRECATAGPGAASRPGQLRARLEAALGAAEAARLRAPLQAATRGWTFPTARRATLLWAGALGLWQPDHLAVDESLPPAHSDLRLETQSPMSRPPSAPVAALNRTDLPSANRGHSAAGHIDRTATPAVSAGPTSDTARPHSKHGYLKALRQLGAGSDPLAVTRAACGRVPVRITHALVTGAGEVLSNRPGTRPRLAPDGICSAKAADVVCRSQASKT